MNGNGGVKLKIKQTINPKDTEKLTAHKKIDADKILRERRAMLEAQATAAAEAESPRLRARSNAHKKSTLIVKPIPVSGELPVYPQSQQTMDGSPVALGKTSGSLSPGDPRSRSRSNSGVMPEHNPVLKVFPAQAGDSQNPDPYSRPQYPAANNIQAIEEEPSEAYRSAINDDTRKRSRSQTQQPVTQSPFGQNQMSPGREYLPSFVQDEQASPVSYKRGRKAPSFKPQTLLNPSPNAGDFHRADRSLSQSPLQQNLIAGGNQLPPKFSQQPSSPERGPNMGSSTMTPRKRATGEQGRKSPDSENFSPTYSPKNNGSSKFNLQIKSHATDTRNTQIPDLIPSHSQTQAPRTQGQQEFIPYVNLNKPTLPLNQKPPLFLSKDSNGPRNEGSPSPANRGLMVSPSNNTGSSPALSKHERLKKEYLTRGFVAANSPVMSMLNNNSSSPEIREQPKAGNVPMHIQAILNKQKANEAPSGNTGQLRGQNNSGKNMRISNANAGIYNNAEKGATSGNNSAAMVDKLLGMSNPRQYIPSFATT